MPGRIPDSKIDEIRLVADIVDVIGGYVSLKRRGRNYMALCPFHNEKTPSFSVSPDKQIFHCFGCGKGGNVFTFLMEHEKVSFVEAVRLLADRYGITLPRYEPTRDARTERMLYANEVAAQYFQEALKNEAYRAKIEPYLYEKRGLSPGMVEKFRIGLAPDDWKGFLTFAQKKDLKPEELLEAGLAVRSEKTGEYYDRFRTRLMFPIFNLGGKVVGFGGRTLKKGDNIKYMNSPETSIYNKSYILYGMNFARSAIRDSETAILVEGYFDLISLFQAGIENVVAVSGTAFTDQQARLLGRFAQTAYLFFDADSAGRNAALRSVEYFFNAGIEPIIVTPPPGHDPDSYVREYGQQGVYRLLEEGLDYLSFRFDKIDIGALAMREKEQVARDIRHLGAKIDDDLRRDIFFSAAAERLSLPVSAFEVKSARGRDDRIMVERSRNIQVIESEFLSTFLIRPILIESVWKDVSPDDFTGPGHKAIYSLMLEAYRSTGEIKPDELIEKLESEAEKSALALIATLEWGDLDLGTVVKDYKRMILDIKRKRQIAALQKELAGAEAARNRELAQKLTREIKYLLDKRR
jgi:DNA primase